MKMIKRVFTIIICCVIAGCFGNICFAEDSDGSQVVEYEDYNYISEPEFMSKCTSESMVLFEASTGEMLLCKNETSVRAGGHLVKLMTLLLVAEQIDCEAISLNSVVTVSKHANSMQGTQIWLNVGEKITIEELIKAISIGNANDACVALAECVGKSESEFVAMMNDKAKTLSMHNTVFVDSTGISDKSVTTAEDVAKLCCEFSKYDFLVPYLTTWLDNVRSNATELVNNNTLVKSYNGITGMKACFGDKSGNCIAASAKRNDMTLIAVILGAKSKDNCFSEAKEMLNFGFAAYQLFNPTLPVEISNPIYVHRGEKLDCEIQTDNYTSILIPKYRADDVNIEYDILDRVTAPVFENSEVGIVWFLLDDKILCQRRIVTSEAVDELTIRVAFYRLWSKLIKM